MRWGLQGTFLTIRKHSTGSASRIRSATSFAAPESWALLKRRNQVATLSTHPHLPIFRWLLGRGFPGAREGLAIVPGRSFKLLCGSEASMHHRPALERGEVQPDQD